MDFRSSFLIVFMVVAFALQGEGQSYYSLFRPKPPTGGGGTPGSGCDRVNAEEHDQEEITDGQAQSMNSSDLEIGNDGSERQNFGMYFNNFSIPAGATIDSAFVQFAVDNESIDDPLDVRIFGQEGSTPGVFTEDDNDILNRDWTETYVGWTLTGESWEPEHNQGPNQRTPNLASVIQEIVDNPSYSQGDPFVIIVSNYNDADGEREAESYDGDDGDLYGPEICIYWTTF